MAPLSVVVVEDDQDAAELLAELIARDGHRVRIAPLGATALVMLEQEVADLVFLDVTLPDMDGYQVATAIRLRFGETCRIVALTGFSSDEKRDAARNAGCDAFAMKPCRLSEIRAQLHLGQGLRSRTT